MLNFFKGKPGRQESEITTKPISNDTTPAIAVHNTISIGRCQDLGARKDQQDSYGISDESSEAVAQRGLLTVLADGMGGLNNGALYSGTAVMAALTSFQNEEPEKDDGATLLRVLKRASEAVKDLTEGGTTFVAALIRERKLHFISVGDSRISLMRNGGLIQLNREHIYGRELDDLAMNGMLSEREAEQDKQRAALTSYVGKPSEILIDRNISPIPLYSGDKVILMSDGVYGYMPEDQLTELLLLEPNAAAEAVKNALVSKASPGQDNLTIVILQID